MHDPTSENTKIRKTYRTHDNPGCVSRENFPNLSTTPTSAVETIKKHGKHMIRIESKDI
jgi:hypothetical protein